MNSQLPSAVRATAAALAVFMTMATLDRIVSIAEPQQSLLMAHNAARQAAEFAAAARDHVIVAQSSTSTHTR
jgi:hypothetical protein